MNDKNNKMIITRFAPSPTGVLHIGGARTALFNYLFTKQNKGEFILRIDNTDKERSKKDHEREIIENLEKLGIKPDRKLIYQSERTKIYKGFIQKLIDDGFAYISKEEKGERDEVIRFRNPNKKIIFNDLIRGKVEFQTDDLGDFVIAKSLEEPIYHLASVIDDFEFGITHLIRAEEHLSNTPRQILLIEAIKAPRPIYAHIPLVLASDRSKLSKRHGAISVSEFLNNGYEPEAFVNYLALLGWHPTDEKEIFSFDELVRHFKLERVQKGGAIWDIEKLNWVNKEHLKLKKDEVLKKIENLVSEKNQNLKQISKEKISNLVFERMIKRNEAKEILDSGEFSFFFSDPNYEKTGFLWKGEGEFEKIIEILEEVKDLILKIKEAEFNEERVKKIIWPFAESQGRGDVLWPFRFALSGLKKSPDPFLISEILGKEKTINRLEEAILFLKN